MVIIGWGPVVDDLNFTTYEWRGRKEEQAARERSFGIQCPPLHGKTDAAFYVEQGFGPDGYLT